MKREKFPPSVNPVSVYAKWDGVNFDEPASADAPPQVPGWIEALKHVSASHEDFSKCEKSRVTNLLLASDQRLHPLADPLHLALSTHRWLDPGHNREESYSDWLSWILQASNSTASMLRILGLSGSDFETSLATRSAIEIAREHAIPVVDAKGKKRPDIVVFGGDEPVLILEIKIKDLDVVGGRENLPLYARWLKERQPNESCRRTLLIVPDEIEPPSPGWTIRSWRQICLSLRHEALSTPEQHGGTLLVKAMMLAFAGAVEQNVLGIGGDTWESAAPTASYLESWLMEDAK